MEPDANRLTNFTMIPDPHHPETCRHAVPCGEEEEHWIGDGVPCGCGERLRYIGLTLYVVHRRVRRLTTREYRAHEGLA